MDPRRRRPRRRLIIGLALTLVLALAGTTGWALDRFVIRHVEIADVASYETAEAPASSSSSSTSDAASVSVRTVVEGASSDTVTYYVADVLLGDATQLRSAFADNQFGENITERVSTIAVANGARLAINGDYYGFRDSGIVIRNGTIYRDKPARTGLVIYRDGTMKVYDETATTAAQLVADGAWQTLSFGPALVSGGEVVDGIDEVEIDTNVGNHSIQGQQPRSAIGMIAPSHFVFVVVDGRQNGYSSGVTLTGLATIMRDLGATEAYNLDGGGSSELWSEGSVVNRPSNGGERATSDILYIGS